MRKLLLAIALGLGTSAMMGSAQAMPVNTSGAVQAVAGEAGAVEQVALVCNRFRCWHTGPRFYGPRFYGGRYWGGRRWGGHWHGGRHWGGGHWGHRRW